MSGTAIEAKPAEPHPPAHVWITLEIPEFKDPGITMIAMLAAVMERFKDLPEHERQAAMNWFNARYNPI